MEYSKSAMLGKGDLRGEMTGTISQLEDTDNIERNAVVVFLAVTDNPAR